MRKAMPSKGSVYHPAVKGRSIQSLFALVMVILKRGLTPGYVHRSFSKMHPSLIVLYRTVLD
jgi:hypothetical protein